MKKKVLIVAIVAVLLLIAGGYAIASSNSNNSTQPTPTQPTPVQPPPSQPPPTQPTPTQPPPPVQPTPSEPAVLEMTVEQLIKNAVANPKKYEGKVIQVSGVVIDRKIDMSAYHVVLGPETMGYTVWVSTPIGTKNAVDIISLGYGYEVTIRGKYYYFSEKRKEIALEEAVLIAKKSPK